MTIKEFENFDKAFENGEIIKKFNLEYIDFANRSTMICLSNRDCNNNTFNELFNTFIHETDHKYHLYLSKPVEENKEEGLFIRHDNKVLVSFDFEFKELEIFIFQELRSEDLLWIKSIKEINDLDIGG